MISCTPPAAVPGPPEARALPRALLAERAALGGGAGGLAGTPGAVLIPGLTGDTWSVGVDLSSDAACSLRSPRQARLEVVTVIGVLRAPTVA